MKATGIVRRIDDLGRVVIPKDVKIAARAPFARQNRATVPEERASPYSGKNSMLKYSRHTKV